ncbi:MAG: hypothetical protein HY751_07590 [Nitrospinae bacterium]|nr:hypothetical protein [Nitrospinota bacterium]
MNVKLTGWKAVAALAMVPLYFLYYHASFSAGMPYALDVIKTQLAGSYYMAEIERQKAEGALTGVEKITVSLDDVEVKTFLRKRPVIRVKPLVNGEPPPDGKEYRYFVADYSPLIGWGAIYETGKTAWSLW